MSPSRASKARLTRLVPLYRSLGIADDPDIHVLTNLSGVGNMEVNAFQRAADVVVGTA